MDSFWEDAVQHGDAAAVADLLRRGIDANARNRFGQTGLMIAAHAGHHDVIETLIGHGADLNVTAKFGLSALMLATVSRHYEIARLLARAGADLTLRGSGAPGFAGKTAADFAAEHGQEDLAAELSSQE